MKFDFYSLISSVLQRAGGKRRVCFPLISRAGSLCTGLSEREGLGPQSSIREGNVERQSVLPGGRKTNGRGHRLRRGRKHRGMVL